MTTPLIVTQLRTKQAEVEAEIVRLEARIADARASVIHIASVIRLFDPKASDAQPRAYQAVSKAMKRLGCSTCAKRPSGPLPSLWTRASSGSASSRPKVGTLRTELSASPCLTGSASCSPSASGVA